MSSDPPRPAPWPEGYGLVILDEVDSTMAEARRMAAATLDRPTWIMARRQTNARGRRGRTWLGGDGNLAATLVYRPWCSPSEAAARSFMAANALFEALALYAPRDSLALKWPNDVLLNGGKVAGILLESAGTGPLVDWLSIGVGVNLARAPEDMRTEFPPVSLRGEGGHPVGPEEFLCVLAGAFATQEGKLAAMGFPRIREDWLSHAARLGEVVTARTARAEITGIFESVDQAGNLILRVEGREVLIPAADVYF
ncbi:biotin--[acetyl-CoA-carboxylase] ligase [Rubellimicrobium sp. CFH 75288]|uniref:biotin--[acetyl-CoA-carboxylase] ligase n=1 Tax=Rubellimicrobium sp. CFH 75288 TaxID=2697034 RepID=UPI001412C82C|nr:biotin--[acetyl-CoA-carboxylase] ligase [Rubellimicrobium sp. CFH 75288]NAZ35796.1 biotin--[acetyl-CoA-carboxylase] ligase [Rubellimicrobium sp. CFH 75288]